MKVALVHDYLREFGGAERVLRVLANLYPEAPIYTAFSVKWSSAEKEFRDRKIVESPLAPILKIWRLYSPLRFLIPLIWRSFDLSTYDLVITSCSWYITRGFRVGPSTKVIAYCHTPPRWLYGYETSVGFTKYWPVKVYAAVVGHFLRMYDYKTAQPIKYWVANSKNVQARIKKFYRKDSIVIYPPVDTESIKYQVSSIKQKNPGYFLIAGRLVGAKGIESALKAFSSRQLAKYKLKIVGETAGFSNIVSSIKHEVSSNIELLGRVKDEELYRLYAGAKGFIALARQEDFGMTVVEAMAAGTPVIAFNGGGFKETVVDGVTGVLIDDTDEKTIIEAVKRLGKTKWNKTKIQNQARGFSRERFEKEIKGLVEKN